MQIRQNIHIGHYISGAGHAALILWLLFGGLFEPEPEPFEVTEVAVLSEAEFAALTARSQPPQSTVDVAAPPAPELAEEPAVEAPPPEPAPVQTPEPEAVAPPPEPEAAPVPPEAPPQTEVADTAPVLDTPPPDTPPLPATSPRPQPRPAPRVAPEPVAPPEPDTAVAEVEQQAVVPDAAPAEVPPEPEPEQEATSPEAATTEIVTEATEPASAAPAASLRPQTRPNRPAPTAEPAPQQAAPAPAPATDTADAVAEALAQALAGGGGTTSPQSDLPTGPPMTSGEKDALRVAVQACWIVDVGSQAASVTVTVAMDMAQNGKVAGDIRMIASEGGSADAVQTAFQTARRAILRCQKDGYDLPTEKYAQWREIEMTFNPDGMRVR